MKNEKRISMTRDELDEVICELMEPKPADLWDESLINPNLDPFEYHRSDGGFWQWAQPFKKWEPRKFPSCSDKDAFELWEDEDCWFRLTRVYGGSWDAHFNEWDNKQWEKTSCCKPTLALALAVLFYKRKTGIWAEVVNE